MRYLFKTAGMIAAMMLAATTMAEAAEQFITFSQTEGYETLEMQSMRIVVDETEDKAVHHAAADLADDIERVTGLRPDGSGRSIIIGTPSSSSIKKYVKEGIIKADELKGKWETYVIATAPDGNIVIAGSDRRGCVYGIYELSRQIGVSPWYWWADIPVERHETVYIKPGSYTDGEPKVKYRGIFINDENPCMQKWARMKMGGMNSKMYGKVYELLLRMKANLLWPGMWGTFKEHAPFVYIMKNADGTMEGNCFNWDDPLNPKLADERGIVVGTSHHEPMQRSQQEWVRTKNMYGNGAWNYQTNANGLKKFFREGIENTKDYESMITIGMRGDEDRPMEDAGGREANMRLLRQIFKDQRKIIADVTGKPASRTPQVWTLYSEMLDYYDEGLQVPEDVTVMLCDDNWGDIRKIPSPDMRNRKGGFGMYYHFSYYGAPRAMKWLQQMQVQQVWQQMDIAYRSGIDRVWIVNVGDIKPAEFVTQFFMDMAWNPDLFNQDNLMEYTESFCRTFAGNQAKEAARLLNLYNKYASRVTAEMLCDTTYDIASGEWKRVRDEFLALEAEASRLDATLKASAETCASKDAYYQIVLYPIQALANLHDLYYSVAMNHYLAQQGDMEANEWAERAERCFSRDSMLTHYYNIEMNGGKWNGIMTQPHIGYSTWHGPEHNIMPKVVRLTSAQERKDGHVHTERKGTVAIEAQKYYAATATDGAKWTVIPHLGRTSSALTLMPPTIDTGSSCVSYRMSLSSPCDSMRVKLIFSTVMPFVKGGHNVKFGFAGCESHTANLNKDMNWQHCYDLMYPAGAARVIETEATLKARPVNGNVYQLDIHPLTQGLVLQRVEVTRI